MKFSVIIPTYNRPLYLKHCLEALSRLDFPRHKFEVIVANDGSDMSLDEIVKPYLASLDLRLVNLMHGGVAHARNRGVSHAQGDYVVFVDDDCRCYPDWLKTIEHYLDETPNAMVGGRLINMLVNNSYSVLSQHILDMVYTHYNPDPDQATFLAGANLAMSRKQYLAIGGCDEVFPPYGGEDRDLCDRWRSAGNPIRFAPSAMLYHSHPLNLMSFMWMYYSYGRGAYVFHHLRGKRGTGSRKIEQKFYTSLSNLLQPTRQTSYLLTKLKYMMLIIIWQMANLSGYVHEWWKWRNKKDPLTSNLTILSSDEPHG